MRWIVAFIISTSAASAWESSSAGPVCLLSHVTEKVAVTVSHDPGRAEAYGIEVVRAGSIWNGGPAFIIRFDGPGQRTISTGRHRLSDDGASVSVTDSGFGNVLAGIASNFVAMAVLGDQAVTIPLEGAAPAVSDFENCVRSPKV